MSNDPRRKVLKESVCLLVSESGFTTATDECIETLVEMLQSLLSETGNQTKNFAELAGRTQPVVGDVVMAMINMGMSIKDLDKYATREGRPSARNLNPSKANNPLQILQAGTRHANPVHIPNYLPPLPDPHAYVRTATYKQPETEYEAIREKSANQKRDIEKALTKFLARTSADTHNLFDDEENQMFPLIACKPSSVPAYLSALNPCDQIFDWEELEYYYQVANRKPTDDSESEPEEMGIQEEIEVSPAKKRKNKKAVKKEPTPAPVKETAPVAQPEPTPFIDNPFLRSIKKTS
ncbi:CLUMA_CG001412, isoform A [Clunio marinus]|uniref:Transcription initiation factor TFIID subunit 8 n=1 Tax=Clunio marinus TaxID=568069 RepID=A0A1J1HHU9_9DIPT|nr:CLUMA_CG001412, isoform A [Clunio marinus]